MGTGGAAGSHGDVSLIRSKLDQVITTVDGFEERSVSAQTLPSGLRLEQLMTAGSGEPRTRPTTFTPDPTPSSKRGPSEKLCRRRKNEIAPFAADVCDAMCGMSFDLRGMPRDSHGAPEFAVRCCAGVKSHPFQTACLLLERVVYQGAPGPGTIWGGLCSGCVRNRRTSAKRRGKAARPSPGPVEKASWGGGWRVAGGGWRVGAGGWSLSSGEVAYRSPALLVILFFVIWATLPNLVAKPFAGLSYVLVPQAASMFHELPLATFGLCTP